MKIFLALITITASISIFGAEIERNTDGSISISGEYWVDESLSLDKNQVELYNSLKEICKEEQKSEKILTDLLLYEVESNNEIFSSGIDHIKTKRSVSIKIHCQIAPSF